MPHSWWHCHQLWKPLRWLTPPHVQGDCHGNTPGACEQHTFGVGGWLWAEFLRCQRTFLAIITVTTSFSSSHDLKCKISVSFGGGETRELWTATPPKTWNNILKPHNVCWKAGCHSITRPQQVRKACQQDEAVLKTTPGCFQLILPLYLAIKGVNGRHDVYTFAAHEMVKSCKVKHMHVVDTKWCSKQDGIWWYVVSKCCPSNSMFLLSSSIHNHQSFWLVYNFYQFLQVSTHQGSVTAPSLGISCSNTLNDRDTLRNATSHHLFCPAPECQTSTRDYRLVKVTAQVGKANC